FPEFRGRLEELFARTLPGWLVPPRLVLSSLGLAQRRAVDVNGVAVVADAAQQRVHHCWVAQKVPPFVVSQICGNDRGVAVVALFHELEENVGLLGFHIDVAELIDEKYVKADQARSEERRVVKGWGGRAS